MFFGKLMILTILCLVVLSGAIFFLFARHKQWFAWGDTKTDVAYTLIGYSVIQLLAIFLG